MEKKYRRRAAFFSAVGMLAAVGIGSYFLWEQVPSKIHIVEGVEEELTLPLPMSADKIGGEEEAVEASNMGAPHMKNPAGQNRNGKISNAATSLTLYSDCMESYQLDLKLFGVIPFKTMDVEVVKEQELIPAGIPIGIYVKTEGVLVIDTGEFRGSDGVMKAPAGQVLKKGDYILEADGEAVEGKNAFMEKIASCGGKEMILKIRRKEEVFPVKVKPAENENGEYKLGIWIRDNAQGVGTLTYLDEKDSFGALGHGINDMDTATLMELESGSLYRTNIVSVTRGESGEPGELTGVIDYKKKNRLGSIERNTKQGIFGQFTDENVKKELHTEPLPVGLKQNIRLGEAQILCTTGKEKPMLYDAEITAIHLSRDNINRGLEIQITDERLMEKTGGIVQGMSGSPIIQDGKIIGAVTHVLVQDPTRGYGIFIETMLSE